MKVLSNTFRNQHGFETVALVVVVLVLGVVGFAGYKVHQNSAVDTTGTTTGSKTTTVPASINSQADLAAASKSLDNASADVNSQVNGNTLDSDINDLL